MGRPRRHNRDLPPYVHLRSGTYWYVRGGQWTKLGRDRYEALIKYASLVTHQSVLTVGNMLDEYFVRYLPANPVEPGTLESYRHSAVHVRAAFGDVPLAEVRLPDVKRWLMLATKKPRAVNAARFFSLVLNVAAEFGYIERNPLSDMKYPKLEARSRVLSDDELRRISEHLYAPIRVIVDLAMLLSARVSEVCGIRHADIRDGVLWLWQKKTKKAVPFTITPELAALLDEAKSIGGKVRSIEYLMLNERRKPFDPRYVSQAFSAAAKRAGVPNARFHDLRRTSADRDQDTAQKRLGHADERTTRKHYRVTPQPVMPLKTGKK